MKSDLFKLLGIKIWTNNLLHMSTLDDQYRLVKEALTKLNIQATINPKTIRMPTCFLIRINSGLETFEKYFPNEKPDPVSRVYVLDTVAAYKVLQTPLRKMRIADLL